MARKATFSLIFSVMLAFSLALSGCGGGSGSGSIEIEGTPSEVVEACQGIRTDEERPVYVTVTGYLYGVDPDRPEHYLIVTDSRSDEEEIEQYTSGEVEVECFFPDKVPEDEYEDLYVNKRLTIRGRVLNDDAGWAILDDMVVIGDCEIL